MQGQRGSFFWGEYCYQRGCEVIFKDFVHDFKVDWVCLWGLIWKESVTCFEGTWFNFEGMRVGLGGRFGGFWGFMQSGFRVGQIGGFWRGVVFRDDLFFIGRRGTIGGVWWVRFRLRVWEFFFRRGSVIGLNGVMRNGSFWVVIGRGYVDVRFSELSLWQFWDISFFSLVGY